LVEGHTLVIPKKEVDKFLDMPDNYLSEVLLFAKPIAAAIEKSFPCNRCGLSVVGLEVPHAHLHLIPLNTMNDINFTRKKLSPTNEQLKKAQGKILKAMES
jgi:histidine triad (HIT) family protein